MELPNTKIRSVVPNPLPQGDPTYVVSAWGGATVDPLRNRLLVWGGGHANYWGNEVYAVDLPSMSIKRVVEPSSQTAASNCSSALPDGTPTSRHTYDGLTYITHADRFFSVGGALTPCGYGEPASWTYNFNTKAWQMMIASGPLSSTVGDLAVYDAATRLVYVKDQSDLYAYSYDTNKYTKLNTSQLANDYHLSATIDTKRRKFVMIGSGSVQLIDLTTYKMTTMSTTNTPALVGVGSPGAQYDPIADRVVAWSGGSDVYALNMDTGAWTSVATGPGPTAAAVSWGTFGRWAYVPAYRVYVLVNDIDQNAWVFRLTN